MKFSPLLYKKHAKNNALIYKENAPRQSAGRGEIN
jgi:hypothetical protein